MEESLQCSRAVTRHSRRSRVGVRCPDAGLPLGFIVMCGTVIHSSVREATASVASAASATQCGAFR